MDRVTEKPPVTPNLSTEIATREPPPPPKQREAVFALENVQVVYGDDAGRGGRVVRALQERDHGVHRAVGLRQVDADPLPEPDERPHPVARRSAAACSTTGVDLYGDGVDPVQVRKRIGMVFQKPNPFPKSIYDNVAFGPRVLGMKGDMDEIVERSLRKAALWDEVKDRLKTNAFGMSGGQQQRLCIARALAIEPDVILMDEPASALDPISTAAIEDLMLELVEQYSIVIVTHNMQQAARVSNRTAFFNVDLDGGRRVGRLVEYAETEKIFTNPDDERTKEYVTGKFG